MQGMGGTLSSNNPLILAAFEAALRHQALIVLVLLLVAATAWVWPYTVPKPKPDVEPELDAARPAAELGEHPARKFLRITFGLLWIFDGLLQLQQAMPVGLPTDVVQPAAATSPSWVQHVVNNGVLIWLRHPIPAAASAVAASATRTRCMSPRSSSSRTGSGRG